MPFTVDVDTSHFQPGVIPHPASLEQELVLDGKQPQHHCNLENLAGGDKGGAGQWRLHFKVSTTLGEITAVTLAHSGNDTNNTRSIVVARTTDIVGVAATPIPFGFNQASGGGWDRKFFSWTSGNYPVIEQSGRYRMSGIARVEQNSNNPVSKIQAVINGVGDPDVDALMDLDNVDETTLIFFGEFDILATQSAGIQAVRSSGNGSFDIIGGTAAMKLEYLRPL